MSKKITFEESLGDSDWGLIIDSKGQLKGLFIPDGASEDDVPETIVNMCITPVSYTHLTLPTILLV